MRAHRYAFLLCCGLLAACGGDKTANSGTPGDDGLPKPAAASGSVTGMPNPGVAQARPAASEPQAPYIVELPDEGAVDELVPPDSSLPPPVEVPPVAPPEPPVAPVPEMPAPAPADRNRSEAQP